MFQIILRLIAVLIMLAGVILIYDSRILTKKFFGFGDQNEGAMGLKLFGFIAVIVGGLIIYFNL